DVVVSVVVDPVAALLDADPEGEVGEAGGSGPGAVVRAEEHARVGGRDADPARELVPEEAVDPDVGLPLSRDTARRGPGDLALVVAGLLVRARLGDDVRGVALAPHERVPEGVASQQQPEAVARGRDL